MRLIDADELLKHKTDHEMISTHLIYNMPTIEAEPIRRGRWGIEPGIGCKCSACGFDIGNDLDFMEYVNYCPNCGARMEG